MKKKTKVEPWKPAQESIIKGMTATNQVFDENQPRLQGMATQASDAFNSIAPRAFQPSPFVTGAQNAASAIGSGGLLGANPGQATYDRLQGQGARMGGGMGTMAASPFGGGKVPVARPGGMGAANDPSMGLLGGMATDDSAFAGSDTLRGLTTPGNNPADGYASNVAGGQYLNNQPSAGLYGEVMDRSYSTSNPFLDNIIRQNDENVTTQAARQFGARGMGAGISSAFADVLSKNLANTGGQLRYQNYNDAENRRLQAGGQSDAAFANERGLMSNANALLSSNFNAGQDRSLAAGQGLMQGDQANRAQQLSAAQSLGSQFNQGADRSLDAARAGDAAQQSQVQQMLTALAMTGDLRGAEFAGIAPALGLLNTAADIPYVGTAALNGQIRTASNGYGTTTQSGGLGQALLSAGTQLGSAAIKASDRRLKTNIAKVGALKDGLGVYEFDYRDGDRFGHGRFKGVMADEVAALRPWALGPKIDGEFASVDYSKLEAA